ncbi:hypothetical protein EYV94_21385 [Puteibacter caeruleilacunae]|nr:hypothetical protein EYV94_21385 [Puteibacter caeruleilacunae]
MVSKELVYNKHTNQVKPIDIVQSKPFPFIFIDGIANESFFSVMYPYVLESVNKNGKFDDFLSENNLQHLKATDNPVIAKFRFKF